MKLYYSPLACSLADHIALVESGVDFESERVDLKSKLTETGGDFNLVTSKGYVPALVLDDGEVLTENIAVLDFIASRHPPLAVQGNLGRTRMLEALTYISTEVHGVFKPLWHARSEVERMNAAAAVTAAFERLGDGLNTDYLFSDQPSVADCYLFVMLLWAERLNVEVPWLLAALRDRMKQRPAVLAAMSVEGLI
jgi:glutathione S-transferase